MQQENTRCILLTMYPSFSSKAGKANQRFSGSVDSLIHQIREDIMWWREHEIITTISDPNLAFFDLMVNCIDVEEYNTILQSKVFGMCHTEGQLFFDSSPKCNCELAGEGIEYAWGCAHNHYQGSTKGMKKGKDDFINSVAESISRELLTTARCQNFTLCANWYIWAHKKQHRKKRMVIQTSSSTHKCYQRLIRWSALLSATYLPLTLTMKSPMV